MLIEIRMNLDGKVDFEEILNWIMTNIDSDAHMNPIVKHVYPKYLIHDWELLGYIQQTYNNEQPYSIQTDISFKYKHIPMTIFVRYTNINTYESDIGFKYPKDMATAETTYVYIDNGAEGEEIANKLISAFGGWISVDEYTFIRIYKNTEVPKKIRHVTLQDVYKSFGEVVIIDY